MIITNHQPHSMFAFGKRLTKVSDDIIAYDVLFRETEYINTLNKRVNIFVNLRGEVITPNRSYAIPVSRIRNNRHKIDKGLYTYKYGYKTFSKKPAVGKDSIVVPVIIPKGSYYSQNIFGHILSSEIIYPNKF